MMDWHSFPAMGTVISVLDDGPAVDPIRAQFEAIEAQLSRFRPNSELSRVNLDPHSYIEVSALLGEVLQAAQDVRQRTGGLVDPAVGQALRDWGYNRTFYDVVDRPASPEPSNRGISWAITGRVLSRDPGVVLDLGGIAKGWAADRALAETGALAVNAGGDLSSRHPDLLVRIRDPWDGWAATVAAGIGGMATSSTARRSWMVAGARVHHLIDPSSGRPAQTPVIQATASADSAQLAEAAAKAMVLLGERALAWSSESEWVRGGVVVWNDGSIYATRGIEVAA